MAPPITVRRWNASNDEALSEDAVRSRFPPEKYRVSAYRYPALTKFNGAMRRGTCHVLGGTCRYFFDREVTLSAGDVAELPEGTYSMEVVGDDELVIVLCWELPFEFNRVQ